MCLSGTTEKWPSLWPLARPSPGNTLRARRVRLDDGRCAGSAVERKRLAHHEVLWQRGIPGHRLEDRTEAQPGRCERGHVQRLAEVAGGVRAVAMLVKKRSACREKQQGGASKHGERRSSVATHKNRPFFFHDTTS